MDNYLPKGMYLLVVLSIVLMVLMAVVFVEAFKKWYQLLRPAGAGAPALALEE